MFNGPIRGGTRGGQAEFKWSDVSADKDRENYLGHSINAPTGRWQKNKDVHWYSRDQDTTAEEKAEEIRKIKEAEEDALAVALGFKPAVRIPQSTSGTAAPPSEAGDKPAEDADKAKEKEEKRRRKEERRARKAERRERRRERGDSRSRSPSPARARRWAEEDERGRERERLKRREREWEGREREWEGERRTYDEEEMRKERERDRRRWEANAQRERPGTGVWGR